MVVKPLLEGRNPALVRDAHQKEAVGRLVTEQGPVSGRDLVSLTGMIQQVGMGDDEEDVLQAALGQQDLVDEVHLRLVDDGADGLQDKDHDIGLHGFSPGGR